MSCTLLGRVVTGDSEIEEPAHNIQYISFVASYVPVNALCCLVDRVAEIVGSDESHTNLSEQEVQIRELPLKFFC